MIRYPEQKTISILNKANKIIQQIDLNTSFYQ
jgi:hypothetical protein